MTKHATQDLFLKGAVVYRCYMTWDEDASQALDSPQIGAVLRFEVGEGQLRERYIRITSSPKKISVPHERIKSGGSILDRKVSARLVTGEIVHNHGTADKPDWRPYPEGGGPGSVCPVVVVYYRPNGNEVGGAATMWVDRAGKNDPEELRDQVLAELYQKPTRRKGR